MSGNRKKLIGTAAVLALVAVGWGLWQKSAAPLSEEFVASAQEVAGTVDPTPTTALSSLNDVKPYIRISEMIALEMNARARDELATLMEKHPSTSPYLAFTLAELELAASDTPSAKRLLEKTVSVEDRAISHRAAEQLGAIFEKEGDHAAAAELYDRVAKSAKSDNIRYKFLLRRATALFAAGRLAQSAGLYHEILASNIHPQFRMLAANELRRRRQNITMTSASLAKIFYTGGDFLSAATYYKQAAEFAVKGSENEAENLFYYARSLERADRFSSAINVYKGVQSRFPRFRDVEISYFLGLSYQRIGKDEEGESHFKKVLSEAPRSSHAAYALYRLATRRDQKDRRDDALYYYNRLLTEFPRSHWADEAAWRIGFAHFDDGKYRQASQAFDAALRKFPRSDYGPPMRYWRARVLERMNDPAAAEQFTDVLRWSTHPYYQYRASIGLKRVRDGAPAEASPAEEASTGADYVNSLRNIRAEYYMADGAARDAAVAEMRGVLRGLSEWAPLYSLEDEPDTAFSFAVPNLDDDDLNGEIQELVKIGAYEFAADELSELGSDPASGHAARLRLAQVYALGNKQRLAIREVEKLLNALDAPYVPAALPKPMKEILYPLFFSDIVAKEAKKNGVEAAFVAAVIREESRFDEDIASWAGAQGLMQIMPATGKGIAEKLGMADFEVRDLLRAEVNIAMGAHYIDWLGGFYDDEKYLILAGYNAGPGNANRWRRQNPGLPEDVWIEKISFKETRLYVKRVLGSYWTFRDLYPDYGKDAD